MNSKYDSMIESLNYTDGLAVISILYKVNEMYSVYKYVASKIFISFIIYFMLCNIGHYMEQNRHNQYYFIILDYPIRLAITTQTWIRLLIICDMFDIKVEYYFIQSFNSKTLT